MNTEGKSIKTIFSKLGRQTGLIVIIFAAILLEVISGIQYYYTRGIVERNLEQQVLTQLTVSALRMDGIMRNSEATVFSQIWHAEQNLDDPEYIETLLCNLVKSESDKIIGAAIGFRPNFYPSKGYWYEPYARQSGDTVELVQIGSEEHDYTTKDFYNDCMRGDTLKWNTPYLDPDGAQALVSTFALPIRDSNGEPIGMFGIDVTTEWIGETVNKIRIYPSSFSMVLSQDGQLIALPDDSLCSVELATRIARMINDSTVVKEEKANGRVMGFDFHDDEKDRSGRVYYALKRREPKWQMVMVCYGDEEFKELHQMRTNILWMALAGLVVLSLIVHLFARSIRRLHKSQVKQERIDSELKIAADIQTQMLPHENNIVRDDISLRGLLTPAREVGGDLYDFFIRDEKLFFCIGDVSGKGAPSAMLMGVVHSLFRAFSTRENNPARVMQSINEASCEGNNSNMFVTLFIGVLDLPTGRLRYCNAGHDVPIIMVLDKSDNQVKPQGRCFLIDAKANLPLGVFDDVKYGMQETQLEPDSTIFLYTDGLTEAKRAPKQMFGLERTQEVLTKCAEEQLTPQQILERVSEELHRFVGDAEQSDDLTMLAIHYTPQQFESMLTETLTIKNRVSEVTRFSSFIKSATEKMGIEKSLAHQLRLAVEEAVVNAIDYAYPLGTEGDIEVRIMSDGETIRFQIIDSGVAFDPTRKEKADTSLSAEDRQIGGLGILLVRELMDAINYERAHGQNILTLVKKVSGN